jgi:hypothetical protein
LRAFVSLKDIEVKREAQAMFIQGQERKQAVRERERRERKVSLVQI